VDVDGAVKRFEIAIRDLEEQLFPGLDAPAVPRQ
jgi:hypothetical protein